MAPVPTTPPPPPRAGPLRQTTNVTGSSRGATKFALLAINDRLIALTLIVSQSQRCDTRREYKVADLVEKSTLYPFQEIR